MKGETFYSISYNHSKCRTATLLSTWTIWLKVMLRQYWVSLPSPTVVLITPLSPILDHCYPNNLEVSCRNIVLRGAHRFFEKGRHSWQDDRITIQYILENTYMRPYVARLCTFARPSPCGYLDKGYGRPTSWPQCYMYKQSAKRVYSWPLAFMQLVATLPYNMY